MTRRWAIGMVLAVLTAACNSDQEPAANAGGAAGSGGGGTSGTTTTTTTGTGGSPESDAGDGATDAGRRAFAIFAGSDFIDNKVSLTAVDWATHTVAGSTVVPAAFADAIPAADRGSAFLLERSASTLLILDPAKPWTSTSSIDLSGSDDSGMGTNPVAIVSTGTKAYVPLYFKNAIAVVDIAQAKVTTTIDLARFADASDSDGLVDVSSGVFDEAAHRAYFLLQHIPQYEVGIEPDRVSHCIAATPLIVAVDTTNDKLVDLPGDAGNGALVLLGANPGALVPDLGGGRLLIVHSGCYDAPEGGAGDGGADAQASLPRERRGIEALTIASGASTWLYRHTGSERLSGLVWVDTTHAFVSSNDATYETHWYAWDPSTTALGAEVKDFPKFGPMLVAPGTIVGMAPAASDAGTLNALVSFDVTSGKTTALVEDIFGDTKYDGQYNGWALLR